MNGQWFARVCYLGAIAQSIRLISSDIFRGCLFCFSHNELTVSKSICDCVGKRGISAVPAREASELPFLQFLSNGLYKEMIYVM